MKERTCSDSELIAIAQYIVVTRATVRAAATHFKVSKSAIAKWMHKEIPAISEDLYAAVVEVFKENTEARASRGGTAAHLSWLKRTGKVT